MRNLGLVHNFFTKLQILLNEMGSFAKIYIVM